MREELSERLGLSEAKVQVSSLCMDLHGGGAEREARSQRGQGPGKQSPS